VFAIACNMTGNGFCGGSLVADPRGDVIASSGLEETVLEAQLDLAAIAKERDQEPSLRMRRPELYQPPSREG
jgi:predicted amidohydrolase